MGYFGRLGHKLSGIGHRLGQKVSAARTGFKRYGGKIAAVAKLIAPKYAGAIDKGMAALTKADKVAGGVQGAVSQVKSGNYMAGAEALRGAAKTAGAGPRMLKDSKNAIEKARKLKQVIGGP